MLVVFIGISGAGKSSLVRELAPLLSAKNVFFEPPEKEWPDAVKKLNKYGGFSALTWFRAMRATQLFQAQEISAKGELVLVDHYMDKLAADCLGKVDIEWLIGPQDPYFPIMKELACLDREKLPNADLAIFLTIDLHNWLRNLERRRGQFDRDINSHQSFPECQNILRSATEKLCTEKGIELVVFQQDNSSVQNLALKLKKMLAERLKLNNI